MYNQITCYHVCNLLTQKWVLLPPPPTRRQKKQPVTGFICNGCFSESTSFKVIRIPKFEGTTKRFKVEMFSSELGQWNSYRVSCFRGVTWGFPCYGNLITLKGVLYWFQKKNGKILFVIVNGNTSHRTGGCECRLIKFPDRAVDVENKYTSQCLGESQRLICYAIAKYKKRTLSVWVLEEDWCLLHKDIQFYDMLAQMEFLLNGEVSMVDLSRDIQVLGFNPDDKNVVIFGFEKYIWAYNIRTRGYEQLLHPSFLSSNFSSPHARVLTFALKIWPTVLPPISRERKSAQLETKYEEIEIVGGCSSATEE